MSKNTNAEAMPAVDKTFLNVLSSHRGGAIITDVSAAIRHVTGAVQLAGAAGEVTLKMKIKPASKGSTGTLIFEPSVRMKVPEPDIESSIFYADADYNLVREDPNQAKLDLRVVEPEKTETKLKEVE